MFPYRCMQSFDRFTGSTDVNSGSLVRGQCHFRDLLLNPLIVCTTLPRDLTSAFPTFYDHRRSESLFRGGARTAPAGGAATSRASGTARKGIRSRTPR